MAQFPPPRQDDFRIDSIQTTYREESNGTRTVISDMRAYWANNSGNQRAGSTKFYAVIKIKDSFGSILGIREKLLKLPITFHNTYNFSFSENYPYTILKEKSINLDIHFKNYQKTHIISNTRNISVNLVNVQEETRLANIETKRLADIENKRLVDIENKRLADIEKSRILKLQNDKLLLEEIRFSGYQVGESRMLELLNQDFDELENFYKIDDLPLVESIPSVDSVESIDSMSKQIPLETVTPVLVVLGIGLVSYYLLKGSKK